MASISDDEDSYWAQVDDEDLPAELFENLSLDDPGPSSRRAGGSANSSSSPRGILQVNTPTTAAAMPKETSWRVSSGPLHLYPQIPKEDVLASHMRTPAKPAIISSPKRSGNYSPTISRPHPTFSARHGDRINDTSRSMAVEMTDQDSDEEDTFSTPLSGSPDGSADVTMVDDLPKPHAPAHITRAATAPNIGASNVAFLRAPNSMRRAFSQGTTFVETSHQNSPSPTHAAPANVAPSSASDDREYYIIAHDSEAQALADSHNFSWGAQYELARGVCNNQWAWKDVLAHRDDLEEVCTDKNSERSAPYIGGIMGRPGMAEGNDYALWAELDREQDAIVENTNRGLGCEGEWRGKMNWWGGQIRQLVHLGLPKDPNSSFTLKLGKMELGRSHRFARRVGSRRLLTVRIPTTDKFSINMEELREWFSRHKFVLCGRVFVPFATKQNNIHLIETTEDWQRRPSSKQGDQYRLSLESFVDWHNPISLNQGQTLTKYAARFDLGLSTSVPALRFDPENIVFLKDECVPTGGRKPEPHEIHTDGCGFMNFTALRLAAHRLGYEGVPIALQGRIFGSKGVWILHPQDHSVESPPRVWIRDSQRKINLVDPSLLIYDHPQDPEVLRNVHPAHFIFDLVAPARVTSPSRLNRLTLMNLSHNGVPDSVSVELMHETLNRVMLELTAWDGEDATKLLWSAVNKFFGVTAQRLKRTASGASRVLGLASRAEVDAQELHEDSDDDEPLAEEEEPVEGDTKPLSVAESILELLQSGFTPKGEWFLSDQMKTALSQLLEKMVKEYRIEVEKSVEMFIVPDPFGVLQEGEIHVKSSKYLLDARENIDPNVLLGDVLIYRNPARLASDVQKVKAVSCPELASYTDVIVLSTKGTRSLASKLAGGDVDGDCAVCIWDPRIVDPFNQPDLTLPPDNFEKDNFEPLRDAKRVTALYQEIRAARAENVDAVLQRNLTVGIVDTSLGIYSRFHEYAIYRFGYDATESRRLALMFNTVLDSRKTGHIVKSSVYANDRRTFDKTLPKCLMKAGATSSDNEIPKRRLGDRFVLDVLLEKGEELKDRTLVMYEHHVGSLGLTDQRRDEALMVRLRKVKAKAILAEEVLAVQTFVEDLYSDWLKIWGSKNKYGAFKKAKGKEKSSSKEVQELAEKFARFPVERAPFLDATDALANVKALCAYDKGRKFGFAVAFQALCGIKASTTPGGATAMTADFAKLMSISAGATRVVAQRATVLGA